MRVAQRMSVIGTETRVRGGGPRPRARGRQAATSSTSRSASPTSTRRRTSATPRSEPSTTAATHYAPYPGIPAAARGDRRRRTGAQGVRRSTPASVVVTPGAKPVMCSSRSWPRRTRATRSSARIPGFPIYESMTRFVGATPVPDPDPRGERLPARPGRARVAGHAADRMLIINSPANPTGGVLTRSDLEAIAEIAHPSTTSSCSPTRSTAGSCTTARAPLDRRAARAWPSGRSCSTASPRRSR